jgi:hypothetical protein
MGLSPAFRIGRFVMDMISLWAETGRGMAGFDDRGDPE